MRQNGRPVAAKRAAPCVCVPYACACSGGDSHGARETPLARLRTGAGTGGWSCTGFRAGKAVATACVPYELGVVLWR